MVNRSYGKLAHAKGTQFERSMFHAERSILNWSAFALQRSSGRTWRLRHSVGHSLRGIRRPTTTLRSCALPLRRDDWGFVPRLSRSARLEISSGRIHAFDFAPDYFPSLRQDIS